VPTPRLLVLMASVNMFGYGILILVQGTMMVTEIWAVELWLVMGLFGIAYSIWLFRLRNKLGTMAEDWMGAAGTARSEIPPDKPVAS